MKAIGRKVIVSPIKETKEETKSGIILASNKSIPVLKGKVVSVGGDVKFPLKKGQTVIFSPYHYDEVEEFFVMEEEDVWAICDE